MSEDVKAMCHRFARLHIAHWRKSRGLPMSRAHSRQQALWWLAAAKGKRP